MTTARPSFLSHFRQKATSVAHREGAVSCEGAVSSSACKAADHLHTQTLLAWRERVLARLGLGGRRPSVVVLAGSSEDLRVDQAEDVLEATQPARLDHRLHPSAHADGGGCVLGTAVEVAEQEGGLLLVLRVGLAVGAAEDPAAFAR